MTKPFDSNSSETRRLIGNYFGRHWVQCFCLLFVIEAGALTILHDAVALCGFRFLEPGIMYLNCFMWAAIGTVWLRSGIKKRQDHEARKVLRQMTEGAGSAIAAK